MNFGSYTGSASTPGPTPITVNCTPGAAYSVAVNTGVNGSGQSYNWNMVGPNSTLLTYKLYQDASRSSYLGGTPNYDTINGTGTGSNQTVYIYSAAPANPAVVPGTYNDSVTVSVSVNGGTTVKTTMSVTASVSASCSVSVLPLSFGTYTGSQVDTTTQINATCTNTTTYSANMDQGLHYSSFYHPRMIGPGGALLSYILCRDSARTQLWGNTANYDGINGTGTGSLQVLTVYARLGAGQYVAPGLYSDTIIVTLNY